MDEVDLKLNTSEDDKEAVRLAIELVLEQHGIEDQNGLTAELTEAVLSNVHLHIETKVTYGELRRLKKLAKKQKKDGESSGPPASF